MSKVIYKYEISDYWMPVIESPITVKCLPGDILDIQIQDGKICMWVMGDTLKKEVSKTFMILPTGHNNLSQDVLSTLHYLKTVQSHSNGLVWHVFEIKD